MWFTFLSQSNIIFNKKNNFNINKQKLGILTHYYLKYRYRFVTFREINPGISAVVVTEMANKLEHHKKYILIKRQFFCVSPWSFFFFLVAFLRDKINSNRLITIIRNFAFCMISLYYNTVHSKDNIYLLI